ncbi:MAG: endolytic transglycosylase MltG [Thermosulfidibacteraceae bacterium]
MKKYLLKLYGGKENKLLFIVLFLFIAFSLYVFYVLVFPLGKDTCVTIEEGESAKDVLKNLDEKGLVRDKTLALYYIKVIGVEKRIMPSTFCVTPGDNFIKLVSKLSLKGLKKVVIPEGFDSFEVAELLEKEGVIKDRGEFLKVVFDRARAESVLKTYNLPGLTLEGYLAPSTYYFSDNLQPAVVADRMVKRFTKTILPELKKTNSSIYQTLVVASIIQRETYEVSEMPIIAGVFYNRLKRGMPLQADPTVIYAIKLENGGYFDGSLSRRDLSINSPYNTYSNPGLPPTPICNPGIDAIKAAMYPSKTDYLYFVSMGNGRHFFSKDLKTHNIAVEKYIKGQSNE